MENFEGTRRKGDEQSMCDVATQGLCVCLRVFPVAYFIYHDHYISHASFPMLSMLLCDGRFGIKRSYI